MCFFTLLSCDAEQSERGRSHPPAAEDGESWVESAKLQMYPKYKIPPYMDLLQDIYNVSIFLSLFFLASYFLN